MARPFALLWAAKLENSAIGSGHISQELCWQNLKCVSHDTERSQRDILRSALNATIKGSIQSRVLSKPLLGIAFLFPQLPDGSAYNLSNVSCHRIKWPLLSPTVHAL